MPGIPARGCPEVGAERGGKGQQHGMSTIHPWTCGCRTRLHPPPARLVGIFLEFMPPQQPAVCGPRTSPVVGRSSSAAVPPCLDYGRFDRLVLRPGGGQRFCLNWPGNTQANLGRTLGNKAPGAEKAVLGHPEGCSLRCAEVSARRPLRISNCLSARSARTGLHNATTPSAGRKRKTRKNSARQTTP